VRIWQTSALQRQRVPRQPAAESLRHPIRGVSVPFALILSIAQITFSLVSFKSERVQFEAMQAIKPQYLERVFLRDELRADQVEFPLSLPFVRNLSLRFTNAVTFFVGENGSGKSTLLEAVAALSGLPAAGGSLNERAQEYAPETESALYPYLRPAFRLRPRDGFFLRAEFQAHFASLLDQRNHDPEFRGDPYARYGGKSLLSRSHGEAFLAVMEGFRSGLFVLDEPEAALSPQRQLALLAHIARLVARGHPIYLSLPTHQSS
jgi:predicted ATPase